MIERKLAWMHYCAYLLWLELMHICLQFIELLLKSAQLCALAINTGIQRITAKEIISRLKVTIDKDKTSLQRSRSSASKNYCKGKNDGNSSFTFKLSKMKQLCKEQIQLIKRINLIERNITVEISVLGIGKDETYLQRTDTIDNWWHSHLRRRKRVINA